MYWVQVAALIIGWSGWLFALVFRMHFHREQIRGNYWFGRYMELKHPKKKAVKRRAVQR